MSVKIQCGDETALIEYVYGEDEERHAAIAAHVSVCPTCTEEVRGLLATREQLLAWAPPDLTQDRARSTDVGAVAPASEAAGAMRWWRQPLPAWAQMAAAVALFATGVGLGSQVTGSRTAVAPSDSVPQDVAASTAAPAAEAPASARDLAALETRLRAEMAERLSTVTSRTAAAPSGEPALLDRVRVLIEESEQRQQRELTLRTAELVKDVDAQRRGDLARIERTFGQMEGTTGVQVEQQRQLLNYLMRVSQRQPQ